MKLADLVAAGGSVVASGRALERGEHPALAQAAAGALPLPPRVRHSRALEKYFAAGAGSPVAPLLYGAKAVGRGALERGVE